MNKIILRLKEKFLTLIPILLISIVIFLISDLLFLMFNQFIPEEIKIIIKISGENGFEQGLKNLKIYFNSLGDNIEYLFFSLQVLQVLIAPIPGQFIGAFGGFIFGFWKGLLITMSGLLTGSLFAILLGRLTGDIIIRKLVSPKLMKKFDFLIDKGGLFNFFMIFLLPAFPDDIICFIAGLTKLRIDKLLLVSFLGRLPGMAVLTFIGANFDKDTLFIKIIMIFIIIVAFFIWIFDKEIKDYFHEHIKKMPGK